MKKSKYYTIYKSFIAFSLVPCLGILLFTTPVIHYAALANPTITSKTLFFIKGILVALVLWSINFLLIKSNTLNIKFSKIDITLFQVIIYQICNRYLFHTNYSFSIRFLDLIALGGFYIILRNIPKKSYILLFFGVIGAGITQAIYGNLQLLGYYASNHSGFKLTGSFFNPGPYAGFLAAVFPVALGLYLFKDTLLNLVSSKANLVYISVKLALKFIPIIGVISILLVIPATQSRGAWLALIVSSGLLFECKYKTVSKFIKRTTTIKKTVVAFATILILWGGLFSIYQFKRGSSDGRLFIWKVSTDIVKDYPVFGVGFDKFKAHYMNYQASYFRVNGETQEAFVADNSYYGFNEFIQFLVENGIVGLLLLLLVFYQILKVFIKIKHLKLVVLATLLSIAVFAFFSYPMEILPIKLVILILLAALASFDSNKFNVHIKSTKLNAILKPVMAIGVLMVVITGFKYTKALEQSIKTWKLALESYQYGDYETAIQEYQQAYPFLKNNGEFLMNYGKALSVNNQDREAVKVLEQAKAHLNTTIIETALGDTYKNLKRYDKAEDAYKNAANMIPSRFYPLYLLAKLYDESGQIENALAMANTILEKEIKVPSTAIKEIKQEMKDIITKNELFN
ncbi:hypothetical protein E1J38_013085 [Seonamhaeicola sediminis]|uniref:O-antigen ligase-related domain-containing protein n=1 Tax=Seonamhaeicola sediminis TaxID=2528206 RepID=A0A562YB19_9FLAO|nr:O-antigen ligase family protein [Seonamhaeicola sediminis]TWO31558.1 hypothetical protein E1J38_013085 [Seonamhaeicola sediminis]